MLTRRCYFRAQNANKQPFGCLVTHIDRDAKEIHYAISICAPRDIFKKIVAYSAAEGRLHKDPCIIKTEIPQTAHEIMRLIMLHIRDDNQEFIGDKRNTNRSQRAWSAATSWLISNIASSPSNLPCKTERISNMIAALNQ